MLNLFFQFYILYFWKEKTRLITSLVSIALGIALFTNTILLGSRAEKSLIDSALGHSVEDANGKIRSVGGNSKISLDLLKTIYTFQGIERVLPRFATTAVVDSKESIPFQYLGFDFLKERTQSSEKLQLSTTKFPKQYLSKSLFERVSGKPFSFSVGDQKIDVTDFTKIDSEGGYFVLEDIESVLKKMKTNEVSYFLVELFPGFQTKEYENFLNYELEKYGVIYESNEVLQERSKAALKSFHLNLLLVSLVSIFISFFLVSNVFTGIYLHRRKDIGIFRTLGMSSNQVLLHFLLGSLFLGVLGSALGFGLGVFLSNYSFFSGDTLLTSKQEITSYSTIPSFLFPVSLFLGTVGTIVSTLQTAFKVYSTPPLLEIKDLENTPISLWKYAILTITLLSASGIALLLKSPIAIPVFGFLSIALLLLVGIFSFPIFFHWFGTGFQVLLKRSPKRFLSVELGIQEILSNPKGNFLTASTIFLCITLVLSLQTLTKSYEASLLQWMDNDFPGEFSILNPKAVESGSVEGMVPMELEGKLEKLYMIKSVRPFVLNTKVNTPKQIYTIHAKRTNLKDREILISTNLMELENRKLGGFLQIPTPLQGAKDFQIVGNEESFYSERGTIIMDLKTYQNYFGFSSYNSIRISLKDGTNLEAARKELQQMIEPYPGLAIYDKDSLKEIYLSGIKKVFSILDSLQASAIFLGILSLVTNLIYNLQTKFKLLGVLTTFGFSAFQKWKLLFFETAFLLLVGFCEAILVSSLISPIIVLVINKAAFGWTLQVQIPTKILAYIFLILPLLSALVVSYPSYLVWKFSVREHLNRE